jgi:rhomboid protease GluP
VSLRRAPVTYLLLAAIAAVFLAETLLGGSANRQVLVLLGANVPRYVEAGQWWRLVASTFLHVGLLHLLFNGWALYQLGQLFEVWMGSARMAAVYFASGIVGSAASVLFLPTPDSVSAGASGAIFGLLGALLAFLLRRRQRLAPAAKSLLLQLAFWAVLNVVLGFTSSEIDNAGHLGGCLAGLLIGWSLRPRWERGAS